MKKGIDHIGVAVSYFCHDGAGNYVFQKRGPNCRDEHDRWDTGGGAVDFGDTIMATVDKEVREEYGTEVLEKELLGYRDIFREHEGVPTHWVAFIFRVRLDREKVVNAEPHKFTEIAWYRLDALPTPLHSQVLPSLELYRDRLLEGYTAGV